MTPEDIRLFQRLVGAAMCLSDGHLTIMRFTTNWRISINTPEDRDGIHNMTAGRTFGEAAEALLQKLRRSDDILGSVDDVQARCESAVTT